MEIISNKEYREREGISKSQLFTISKTPFHFKYELENKKERNIDIDNLIKDKVEKDGEKITVDGDYVISSMPVKDLVTGMNDVPEEYREIAESQLAKEELEWAKKWNVPLPRPANLLKKQKILKEQQKN